MSQEAVSIAHPVQPLYQQKCSPCPLFPWSSVLTLLYQWGLVRKTEPHHRRESSMQGISYIDDKRGEKTRNSKMVVHETTHRLSKAGSCSHPQVWRDSGRWRLLQRAHPPDQSPEARVSEGGPESMCPDCRLTLSFVPVTLWYHLHHVHLLLTQQLPSPPTTQWFVPSCMKPHPSTFCPWKLTQGV